MSSLSPRVAIAVSVVLPVTIVAIVRFDIVNVDTSTNETFRQTRPYEISSDDSENFFGVERLKGGDDTLAFHGRSQSVAKADLSLRPVRYGPQILGDSSNRQRNNRVFALGGDPFKESVASNSKHTPVIHLIQDRDKAESDKSSTLESPEIFQPASPPYCINSIIVAPCEPESLFANRSECCIEINLFRGISERIFQPSP